MPQMITVVLAVSDTLMELGLSQATLAQALGSQDENVAQLTALLATVADDILLDEHYQDVLGDGNWIIDKNGNYGDRPLHDDDRILFDKRLVINGLKYRFLQAKGLEFGEQMRDFITRLNKLAVRANDRVLDLDMDDGRMI